MKPTNNPLRNYINIKVFKNGSLQMTGCKDLEDFYNVTTTLIKILKRGADVQIDNVQKDNIQIYNVQDDNMLEHLDFIECSTSIGIYDVKIRMINSNFKLDYKVDRKKLARILKKSHRLGCKDTDIGYVECKYQPNGGHSCVNIKYEYDKENKPSIFVFQTGAIIITGAKNLNHIIMAYHFVHKILEKYYNEIKIVELNFDKVQKVLAKFFRMKKENEARVDA